MRGADPEEVKHSGVEDWGSDKETKSGVGGLTERQITVVNYQQFSVEARRGLSELLGGGGGDRMSF